jgi:hypothetical protein
MERDIEKFKLRVTYAMWREYAKKITNLTKDIEQKKLASSNKEGLVLKEARKEIRHLKKVRAHYGRRAKKYKKDFRSKNRTYSMKKKGEN